MITGVKFSNRTIQTNKITFGKGNQYTDEDPSVSARKKIREKIESNFDPTYEYTSQMGHLSIYEIRGRLLSKARSNEFAKTESENKKHLHVNKTKFKELNSGFVDEKRKNELYTGPKLTSIQDGTKIAKEAGINTVLSLESSFADSYKNKAEESGLNFVYLEDIGNKTLRTFSVIPTSSGRGPLLKRLMERPDEWATKNEDGSKKEGAEKSISDLQDYMEILNGKNKDYPLPIYYGCMYGTNRTWAWNTIYNILKDIDQTKPLDLETIEKLKKLWDDLEDIYRD